jgi:hypothetical protein
MYEDKTNNFGGMSLKSFHRKIAFNIRNNSSTLMSYGFKFNLKKKTYWDRNLQNLKKALNTNMLPGIKLERVDTIVSECCDDKLRIVLTDNENIHISKHKLCSHIVGGVENGNEIISDDDEIFDLIVSFQNEKEIDDLICDVLYDIQMFHWHSIDKRFNGISNASSINTLKIKFCIEKGLKLPRYDWHYISLASFCRKNDVFDYEKLIYLWNDFSLFLMSQKSAIRIDDYSVFNEKLNVEQLVEKIVKSHPNGGQLSKKKLINMLLSMPDDRLILVRTEKKPHSPKIIKRLFSLLGVKKWRRGIVRLKRISERYNYEAMQPFVSVYFIERE